MTELKKSPRLQFIDTGLLNFVAGLQCHFSRQEDLHAFYRGKIAEHIVGQELLAAEKIQYQYVPIAKLPILSFPRRF